MPSIAADVRLANFAVLESEQFAHCIIVDGDVQVCRRDADIGMTRGVASLSKTFSARKGMRDKGMPPVVDGQRLQAPATEDFARSTEPPA